MLARSLVGTVLVLTEKKDELCLLCGGPHSIDGVAGCDEVAKPLMLEGTPPFDPHMLSLISSFSINKNDLPTS